MIRLKIAHTLLLAIEEHFNVLILFCLKDILDCTTSNRRMGNIMMYVHIIAYNRMFIKFITY